VFTILRLKDNEIGSGLEELDKNYTTIKIIKGVHLAHPILGIIWSAPNVSSPNKGSGVCG
jgi:hypothetical protein